MITTTGRAPLSILLADDEPAIRVLIARYLRSHNIEVFQAENGKEALALFEAQMDKPRLIIADLVMPEMGGLELLSELRQIDSKLPVLLISGFFGDEMSLLKVLDRHTAFLQKPFSLKALTHAIEDLMQSTSPHKAVSSRRTGKRRLTAPAG